MQYLAYLAQVTIHYLFIIALTTMQYLIYYTHQVSSIQLLKMLLVLHEETPGRLLACLTEEVV